MHDFRRHGSPVECSIDAFAAEIEPLPQSAGYTLPADPAVETRSRLIANSVHQTVLHRTIIHVPELELGHEEKARSSRPHSSAA